MEEKSAPEVHLEVSSGFFRISTEKAIYNITVLPHEESSVTKVVEKIVEVEKEVSVPISESLKALPPDLEIDGDGEDDYYKNLSNDIYHEIGELAKSLSTTISDLPAEDRRGQRVELDEAGEKIENAKQQLHDIVTMTEKATMEIMDQVEKVQGESFGVKDLLAMLKDHPAFAPPEEEGGEEAGAEADDGGEGSVEGGETESRKDTEERVYSEIKVGVEEAKALIEALQEAAPASAAPTEEVKEEVSAPKEKKTRFLFPIDVVFQTMYELCTNETVKDHLTEARENAETIFSTDIFVDQISIKVAELEADEDNFYTIPLTNIFGALFRACSDDKVKNLFGNMEKNKDTIFLDQSLPLEVPPTEEIEVEGEAPEPEPEPEPAAEEAEADPRFGELGGLLDKTLSLVEDLENLPDQPAAPAVQQGAEVTSMTREDQADIFQKIEDAFEASGNICSDVSKITEALSFQDISGQQILKIIKLLSDFQVQLLGIVVSFGSQLKHKEKAKDLSHEEGKELAQNDVDQFMKSMTTTEVGGEGALDQNSVNDLLADLGF